MKAYVVFSHDEVQNWLRPFLRPDFRHCWVIWEVKGAWHSLQYTACGLELDRYENLPKSFDLPEWSSERYTAVIEADVSPRGGAAPVFWPGLFTCVTLIKHHLGIRAWWVQTPYQLFKYLDRHRKPE